MGQTLNHGVYLPAEGERNCYSGLASNWNLLDTAIGDIAGKASATHTHGNITNDGKVGTTANLPLITGTGGAVQAGAFGNQANTFCEGNDSRLSDARTPVAHTHVTADVTDLLNTSHEWTKVQTYSDVNAIIIKNNNIEIGNEPSAYNEQRFLFRDKNNQQIAAIKYQNQLSSVGNLVNGLEFSITDKFKDGVRDATGTAITAALRIGFWHDGTKYIYNECRWRSNLLPFGNNTNDIGSSSYQWNNVYSKRVNTQTLNGINPGALSLLDYNNVLDVTSEVPVASLDGNANIDLNDYIPNKTGWLSIVIANTTGNFIKAVQGRAGTAAGFNATRTYHSGAADNEVISLFMPIIAGTWKSVYIKASSLIQMRFYYCLGNV